MGLNGSASSSSEDMLRTQGASVLAHQRGGCLGGGTNRRACYTRRRLLPMQEFQDSKSAECSWGFQCDKNSEGGNMDVLICNEVLYKDHQEDDLGLGGLRSLPGKPYFLVQTCPKWTNLVQNGPKLSKMD